MTNSSRRILMHRPRLQTTNTLRTSRHHQHHQVTHHHSQRATFNRQPSTISQARTITLKLSHTINNLHTINSQHTQLPTIISRMLHSQNRSINITIPGISTAITITISNPNNVTHKRRLQRTRHTHMKTTSLTSQRQRNTIQRRRRTLRLTTRVKYT